MLEVLAKTVPWHGICIFARQETGLQDARERRVGSGRLRAAVRMGDHTRAYAHPPRRQCPTGRKRACGTRAGSAGFEVCAHAAQQAVHNKERLMKTQDIPQFGLLSGYRVVLIGLSVAAPFAAVMYADHGADVIWIENPKVPDMGRFSMFGGSTHQDRRNMRSVAMDYLHGEGREAFLKLMETTDVLIEASVGGRFAKNGLGDEELWKINPGLVIAHVSGYGQTGVPEYVTRAGYDPTAQAFGCTMRMNGYPGQPSLPAMVFPGDYSSAMFAFSMSVAALLKRTETGKGESIDVAQFEGLMRMQANYPINYYMHGKDYVKEGNHSLICALYGTYSCADGEEIYVLFLGPGVLKVGLPLIGLEYGSELFPAGEGIIPWGTEACQVAEEAFAKFLEQHTAAECEEILAGAGVPCSRLLNYQDTLDHPHYQARKVVQSWTGADGSEQLTGVKVVPELTNYPGRVWRGAPGIGQDNEDVLAELGYSSEQVAALYEQGLLGQRSYHDSFAHSLPQDR